MKCNVCQRECFDSHKGDCVNLEKARDKVTELMNGVADITEYIQGYRGEYLGDIYKNVGDCMQVLSVLGWNISRAKTEDSGEN